jgi:energy-coupling factor transporter ATP-binding protein EcfA2
MKYLAFRVRNYKGIQNLLLDISGVPETSIFTLVGLNESGKTTVLEALSHLINPIDNPIDLVPKSQRGKFDDQIEISADLEMFNTDEEIIKNYLDDAGFTVTELDKKLSISKVMEFRDTKLVSANPPNNTWSITIKGIPSGSNETDEGGNKGSEQNLIDYDKDLWNKTVTMIRTDLFPKIVYYPDFLFDFPHKIYLTEQPDEDEEQTYYRQVLQDILDSLNKGYKLETHLVERKTSGTPADLENIEKVLNDMSTIITKTVFEAWNKISKKQNSNLSVSLGNDLRIDPSQPNYYYIEVKIKQGSDSYFVDERSLGFRWFFAFLLFTQFRRYREAETGNTLFLLDEPASNLHQKAQQDLLGSLEKVTKGSTIIYSTHSHHLIKPEWLPGAFIVKNKALDYEAEALQDDFIDSKTDIVATPYHKYVALYPKEETHFKPILDALDYAPSKLEYIPNIVIPEGKFDFYTFRYFDSVVLANEKLLDFYPGAGANAHTPIISLYLAWGRKFVVLLDDDNGGSRAKSLYIKNFGSIVENKIYKLSDIDASFHGFQTEDLIDESERIAFTNTVFPGTTTYDKGLFNKAVQEMLIKKVDYAFSKQTKDNFRKIITFLNSKLET